MKGPETKRSASLAKEFELHSSSREYIGLLRKEKMAWSTVKHVHSGTDHLSLHYNCIIDERYDLIKFMILTFPRE